MKPGMKLVCSRCDAVQDPGYRPVSDCCGALTDPVYDLGKARLPRSDNPFKRFFDLLPVNDASLLPDDAGFTPLVHARNLGGALGLPNLYLKNETVLPTGTTKYRMASVGLPYMHECGVTHFCTSSTGNSSTAYGQLISRTPELRMSLFTASRFRRRINCATGGQVEHFLMNEASFVEAFNYAAQYARQHGYTSERGFFNPGRREGLKLAFLEAAEQAPRAITCYVQAVSSAMGVYGTFAGARELLALGKIPALPKLFCIQQSSCAPMVNAWMEGAERISESHIIDNPDGIAEAILRGNPVGAYPYVQGIVRRSGGDFAAVTEQEIRVARSRLSDGEGIDVCFSAAAALAGLSRLVERGKISAEDTVLVNLTGRDRAPEPVAGGVVLNRVNGQWITDERSSARIRATN